MSGTRAKARGANASNANIKRVVGYARVSSAEQAYGTSLQDQQASISSYAAGRGLRVAKFYVESEGGGREKIEKREQMQALMRDTREGDLILCDKLDRWSRDPEFSYRSVRELREAGAHFYFVSDRIDPATPEGDTALNFRILFAREEHKRIMERTVGTRNILRDRGFYVEGTPPFGYRRSKPKGTKGVEKNVLAIEPEEAALVRQMFRLSARGRSLTEICTELGVAKKRVWSSLRCRTYLGEVKTSRGEWIKGPHEAIVDAALFETVQQGLVARRLWAPRPRSAPSETSGWVFRSLVRCAFCGAKMSGAYAGPHGSERRHYYRCRSSCTSRYVRVRDIEQKIEVLVVGRLGELRDELGSGPEPDVREPVDYSAKRAKLARQRERYQDMYANEQMTLDELRAKLAKVDAERLRLDAEEGASSRQRDPKVRRALLKELNQISRAWIGLGVEDKRRVASMLMSEVGIAADVDPKPAWHALERLVRA